MRLAIRDDDTNYFTSPEALEHCYSGIWDVVPPSLCLISKVKGKWDYWVHQIYKDKHQTDWGAWTKDDTVYPIEENVDLISFLKARLGDKKIDICFHAKHHRNNDAILPQDVKENYIRGAEFYTTRDLSLYIRDEVDHLNALLDCNITVFTPPQNMLSPQGYRSVLKAGLNPCNAGLPFYRKEKDITGLINIGKQLYFRLRHQGYNYPYVLNYSNHSEIPYHYSLQPNTTLESLVENFKRVRRFDGDFVLSTHYVEFLYTMEHNNKVTMKNVLEEFLSYIQRYRVNYVTLSEMLKTN